MRVVVLVSGLLALSIRALAGGGPENVLVVVNDESAESLEVAHYYMHRRGIPRHHVVHLRLEQKRWLALDDFTAYTALVEVPVKRWRAANPASPITTLVLCRHVPVRAPLALPADGKAPTDFHKSIAHLLATMDATRPVARDATALTLDGLRRHLGGNPYYGAKGSLDPRAPVAPDYPLFCVTCLNAFDVADTKAMIDRSVESDAAVPKGTVYLGRSAKDDPRGCYNRVFPQIEQALENKGHPCDIVDWQDGGELLAGKRDVVFYMFGQANWSKDFPAKNGYLPGAVVDNLTSVALTPHSFDPGAGGQTTMCHFLRAGASAVHGCVSEPYTAAFDQRHLHLSRYLEGYALAESFAMSHPLLPWMNLVAGDPIMQPFARRPVVVEESFAAEGAAHRWTVSATSAQPDVAVASIALYVDGVFREEVQGPRASFAISGFDPARSHAVAVATDASDLRAQGRRERRPSPSPGDLARVRLGRIAGRTVEIDLGAELAGRYYAPGAKVAQGTFAGKVLALELVPTNLRSTLELWLDTDPASPPRVRYFDLDTLVLTEALAAADKAARAKDAPGLCAALVVLRGLALGPADAARVATWSEELDRRAASEWTALEKATPRNPTPKQLEALRAFAERYAGLDVARAAELRHAELARETDAAAAVILAEAAKLRTAQSWAQAIAKYEELVARHPGSTHVAAAKQAIAEITKDPAAQDDLARHAREEHAAKLLKMAGNFATNGQAGRAKDVYEEILAKFPDTKAAADARRELGR